MATTRFGFNDREYGIVTVACWRNNHRINHDDSYRIDFADADLPTVATRASQLSTIAMEKFLRMPDANPGGQLATA